MAEKGKNSSGTIDQLIAARISRRQILQYGMASLAATVLPLTAQSNHMESLLGFTGIPVADLVDDVIVPEGYSAEIFYRWGEPVSQGPKFKMDATNTAADQLRQAGMHHDAIQFFSLPVGTTQSDHGLLVMNHEYIDPQLLHSEGGFADSPDSYSLQKMLKEQYAHGISVIEVCNKSAWKVVRPSDYGRRITATTAMSVSGPVAGSDFIKTAADPVGQEILGTFNNCSNGKTPWGTYLSCEENFHGYFYVSDVATESERRQRAWRRYDIKHSYYGWQQHDERFNLDLHPNECNRFGWIIEFDPYDPRSKPVKRTALGRFCHENVAHKLASDKRLAFYSADDSKFEYIYKFITDKAWNGSFGMDQGALLDEGVLYVAKLNDDGTGQWLPLLFGQDGLTKDEGFQDQADVLVHARLAADRLGATAMDRPEWVTVHPESGDVFVSMTKNSDRGDFGEVETDSANPRKNNEFGHIIKFTEQDATSTEFSWDVFVLAGDEENGSTIKGDGYANPDGLMIDQRGVLWVQTDTSGRALNSGEFAQFGNNQMLAVDPMSGETKRFLTGPIGCEVTGVAMTPDLKTMWVNIQHPGDVPKKLAKRGVNKTPATPNAASNWPDQQENGRPRSATVLITKNDGGLIGG